VTVAREGLAELSSYTQDGVRFAGRDDYSLRSEVYERFEEASVSIAGFCKCDVLLDGRFWSLAPWGSELYRRPLKVVMLLY
jgi:hypothetical protein